MNTNTRPSVKPRGLPRHYRSLTSSCQRAEKAEDLTQDSIERTAELQTRSLSNLAGALSHCWRAAREGMQLGRLQTGLFQSKPRESCILRFLNEPYGPAELFHPPAKSWRCCLLEDNVSLCSARRHVCLRQLPTSPSGH